MQTRFCPRCRAEVVAEDGFCLLGHALAEAPEPGSLSELRAEVDRAFEDARTRVATLVGPGREGLHDARRPAEADSPAAPGSAPPAPGSVPSPPAPASSPSSAAAVGPARSGTASPPPPPPGDRDFARVSAADPISAFAPSPRMDWGPRERKLFRRRSD